MKLYQDSVIAKRKPLSQLFYHIDTDTNVDVCKALKSITWWGR